MGVRSIRIDLEDALYEIEDSLEKGEVPDATQLRDLRWAINLALHFTEDHLADAVEGAEPWEHPPDLPYGTLRRLTRGE
ncbi:hypothetical protein ACFQJC_04985 [Haloferax namakaokahaiae]|uniref:Uncharacterized protein n=1 Tax=Haloferax namakaokahaiae TaxID=1748331 RepID=A0ABD5ZC78_9EURY